MKNNKHSFAKPLFWAMLLVLFALVAACSSSTENTVQSESGGQAKQDASKPADQSTKTEGSDKAEQVETLPLSVQLESWGDTAEEGAVLDLLQEATGTMIEMIWVPYADYESRFNIQLSSGDLPDIIATTAPAGQLFSSQVVQAIRSNVFHDLTPYIEDPEFATKYPNLAKYDQKVWDNIRFDGKIYALPRYIDPISANSGIIVRQDLMEAGGFSEPTTFDELSDLIIAMHDQFGIYGLATQSKDLDRVDYKPLAVAFTGVMDWGVDGEGNFHYQSFMPEYKDYLLWLKRLYDAGALDPEFALEQGGSKFNEGKSAIKIHNWYGWPEGREGRSAFTSEYKASTPEARSNVLYPIEGPNGYTITLKPFNRPALISSKVSEDKIPQILALFDYTASDDYAELTKFGLPELHHDVVDGEKITNDRYKEESVGHWSVLNNNYPHSVDSKVLNDMEKGASQEDGDRMTEVGQFAEEKVSTSDLGMYHWSVSSPTYFEKWSSIVRNLNDNRIKVVMGQMSLEEWDAYVAGVMASKDYQQILDEFKAGHVAK